MKIIGIASDHAGFELKQYVKNGWKLRMGIQRLRYLFIRELRLSRFCTPTGYSSRKGECYPGIAICGSGEGIGMTLNKHQGIRAALCWIPEIAHMSRLHNDANVLVMPGRYIDTDMADKIMTEFFNTDFEGGRHQRRIDKIPVK